MTTSSCDKTPDPTVKIFVREADLGPVWDCRCELTQLYESLSAVHTLSLEYLDENVKTSFSTLLLLLVNKTYQCRELLSQTLDQSVIGGKS